MTDIEKSLLAIAWAMALAIGVTLALVLVGGCGSKVEPLSPAQGSELTEYGQSLMRCEVEARAANSFTVFDACAKDAGLK